MNDSPGDINPDDDCLHVEGIPVPEGARGRLGFLLVKVGAQLSGIADDRLRDSGLDERDYVILAILTVDGPDSQHSLARLLGRAPGVIVTAVDQLEHKGFVERIRDPRDRRRSRVTVTGAGQRALARADQLADAAAAELLGGLDSAELLALRALLTKGLGLEREDTASLVP
jgi:DNA-binding MarR family transcriptional regulator